MGIARKIINWLEVRTPLLPSDWADKHRFLSAASSSEPGRWRTKRTPYLKEIMDCLHPDSPVRRVYIMKGHQIGYTEGIIMNGLGWIITESPCASMLVAPSEKQAKKMLQQKIEPMIMDSPAVKAKIPTHSKITQRNTLIHKDFAGGFLVLAGARVPEDLAGTSVRVLFLDEVDRFLLDTGGEGSPIELAIARTAAYRKKKIIMGSTPTDEETSQISRYFESGDQRYYYLPCPHCGYMQPLEIDYLRWLPDYSDAWYQCIDCGGEIREKHKTTMLEQGEWRATEECDPSTRSYHLNSLYSPVGFLSWAEIGMHKDQADQDSAYQKSFINTYLGKTYSLTMEEVPVASVLFKKEKTYERREMPDALAGRPFFITAGVDVQDDRLEVIICAFYERECWVVDHEIIRGVVNSDWNGEVWGALSDLLRTPVWGKRINLLGIDCNHQSHRVFGWIKEEEFSNRVVALQGHFHVEGRWVSDRKFMEVKTSKGGKSRRGNCYRAVNTDWLKRELHKRLCIREDGSESIHFPNGLGREFYDQLCSERMIISPAEMMDTSGLPRYRWKKIRDRNEVFDCMVYAFAMWRATNASRYLGEDRGGWGRFCSIMDRR